SDQGAEKRAGATGRASTAWPLDSARASQAVSWTGSAPPARRQSNAGVRTATPGAAGLHWNWCCRYPRGAEDSVSGFDLAREGDGSLWLILALMLVVLLAGLVRGIWERMPVLFAMT